MNLLGWFRRKIQRVEPITPRCAHPTVADNTTHSTPEGMRKKLCVDCAEEWLEKPE